MSNFDESWAFPSPRVRPTSGLGTIIAPHEYADYLTSVAEAVTKEGDR